MAILSLCRFDKSPFGLAAYDEMYPKDPDTESQARPRKRAARIQILSKTIPSVVLYPSVDEKEEKKEKEEKEEKEEQREDSAREDSSSDSWLDYEYGGPLRETVVRRQLATEFAVVLGSQHMVQNNFQPNLGFLTTGEVTTLPRVT